ncbi:MAG: molybdenum ABC transporter ATP-binding protein [Gammaproteobacteria bacterium]|nr:molybdenum ABC transporter ATP-binding protein [Gammaproteobacteria bacterium]
MIEVNYKYKLNNFLLDVSFTMPENGITVLFGPSGSGKTSVLNLMSGLGNDKNKENNSKFILNDRVIDDSVNGLKLEPWFRNIAYVFQDHRLFPHMTTSQNILFGFNRCHSELKPEVLIEKFKIKELLGHYPEQLSGGQKQRVSMVRALLSQPDLLILDEPLASLDYTSRQELLPFIECIHKELDIPMIYVSHDIKEVLRLADYIIIMDKGKIVDQGDIADLCISQPLLTQQEGASFILDARVTKIIEEDKLVELDCGETILITAESMRLNDKIRVLIHARDVSLCLSPPQDSSILNCVPICIDEIQTDENGKLRVIAKIGEQTIVSLISHRSARQLNINKGKQMYAQFKATAMIK